MRERDSLVVGALVVLLVGLPAGYLFHVSPRFPGSLQGSLIGIAGAMLLVAVLVYPVVKRVPWAHDRVTPVVGLPTLLMVHIYAGVLGPILGVIHSAHKFSSPLGVALVAAMLVVVLSGYVGRFYLARVAKGVRGRSGELATLQDHFSNAPVPSDDPAAAGRADAALALADMEYAVRAEQAAQRLLQRWVIIHVLAGVIVYALLMLHIWAGLYFGLRWL